MDNNDNKSRLGASMTRQALSRFLLAMLVVVTGCASATKEVADAADDVRDTNVGHAHQIAEGSNELGWDVYRQLTQGPKPALSGNVLLSPYSLASALTITYAGARGQTAAEMARTMHLPQDALPSMMQWINLYQNTSDRPYTLSSANAAWVADSLTLEPEYEKLIEKDTEGLKRVDYHQSEVARAKINQWVLDRTQGKIKDLLPQGSISPATNLTLVNALYLKADWQNPFKKEATIQDAFFLGNGTSVTTDLMRQQDHFQLYTGSTFNAIELPYKVGIDSPIELALRIYLPHEVDGLEHLEQHLINEGEIAHLTGDWDRRKVALTLPKFKIEVTAKLVPALKALGMNAAFTAGMADFSGIDGSHDLVISDVIQKTFMEVDEKGTEAAAATAVVMVRTSIMRQDEIPVEFKADHPFLFTLVDKKSGAVLFLGRLVNPQE
jgi:serpin B